MSPTTAGGAALTLDELPVFEPAVGASVEEHLAALEPVRARSWIARSSRGLEVFSYDGCEIGFRDPAFWHPGHQAMKKMGLDKEQIAGSGGVLTLTEGERHAHLHGIVSRWFTPRQVEGLRRRVADLTRELIAPLTEAGSGDFVELVSRRLPGPVFCWMIGAPESEGDRLYRLSESVLKTFLGDPAFAEEIGSAVAELRAFVDDLIAVKRESPGNDIMSILLEAADRGAIGPEDVHSLAVEMLAASTDNTANSAAVSLILLSRRPDQWQILRDDPAGVAQTASEECMRVLPRVRCVQVWAADPARLLGVQVPGDTIVNLDIVAAHHDATVYPDPYCFDVSRVHSRPQLNFGAGRHFCLGAALARMELQAVLETVATEWSTVEPAGEPEYGRGELDTHIRHLPLSVSA